MARRALTVDGESWEVYPSGRLTVYGRDQLGLIFESGTGTQRRRRVTHFSPLGARMPDRAFGELSDRELLELFRQSQPAWTAPEVSYAAH
ncbi:MAG TPA: hypothetical protein VKD28_10940 [Gemmatimonadales bacterium]|nr:hypothetical protein [Gemmatimonadales bacterium]